MDEEVRGSKPGLFKEHLTQSGQDGLTEGDSDFVGEIHSTSVL